MRTYGKLREKIRSQFGTIGEFATALGRDRSSISQKLNGSVTWTQTEIEEICKLLHIDRTDIPEYFFYDA